MGSILGRVSRSDGTPVADATALVTGSSPAHHDLAALTDAGGQFHLKNLAPGQYEILVQAPGEPAQTLRTMVAGDGTATLDVQV